MQHKGIAHSLKDVDTKRGIVQAYWSAFGNKDDQGDIVEKGCWSRSIKDRGPHAPQPRIKFLFEHDEKQLLGKPSELVEDSFGLLATCQIVPTTLGQDCLLLYEAGVLTEHSVGYETVQSQWDSKSGARRLIECVLWEGSVVTWGANSETPVVALKSLTQPDRLSAMADQAARLDSILHSGTLRSDALCETLERELKALHAALAPMSQAASERPYTIQGVLDSMNDLKSRLDGTREMKGATQADKDAQEARSKKYGIGIKDGGNVTKPGQWKDLDDSDFGDPVNYRYPMPDKAHADNAASRFGAETARAEYTKAEQAIIGKRIAAAQKKFSEDKDDAASSDGGKAAQQMTTRMVKGSGGSGDLAVSADGTHAAYTGTHTHSHKAMGSQGGDAMHEHEHSHDGNADHGHDHAAPKANGKRPVRKARDFDTLFASLNASDQLQDDWADTFIAFVNCMEELMQQSCAQDNGWLPDTMEHVDVAEAAQANVGAFGKAVMDLVTRSISADFVPQMTDDMDQFVDPDGPNAEDGDDQPYKGAHRTPLAATPAAPLRMKVGRAISGANRDTLTKALNGIADGVATINEHHGAIKSLLEKTDPDAVRQDEDDALGDDDTENGGDNINKSRLTDPARRSAAVYPTRAATTHQNGTPFDVSAIVADLDALKTRLAAHAR